MAGVEFRGLDQLQRDFQALEKKIAEEAVIAGEDAAAEVFKAAIESAAPRKTGQLESSISIVESKERRKITGSARRGLFVGPEKKKGFYGYFIDRGYTAMGRAGRKVRKAKGTTHSQRGAAGGKHISGTGWFSRAAAGAMDTARRAYEAAFTNKLREMNK